ncbi:MAG: hypothetical protein HY040_03485 [Planctomycetes bacterium]|nr:hypothetical protein [Planctomycetota bacterium]
MFCLQSSAGILLLAAVPALGQGVQGGMSVRNPWHGFEAGSWVILQEKKTLNGKVSVTKFKDVIAKYDGDVPILARTPEVNGQFGDPGKTHGSRPGGLPAESQIVARRQETVTIGDRKVPCAVVEYTVENTAKDFKAKLVFWSNDEQKIPYREIPSSAGNPPALLGDVIRAEYAYHYQGASVKYTIEVVDLAKAVRIGDRDLTCVQECIVFEEKAKDKSFSGKGFRWLSAAVPGHEVRFLLEGVSNGAKVEVERVVSTLSAPSGRNECRIPSHR